MDKCRCIKEVFRWAFDAGETVVFRRVGEFLKQVII